ncbi:tRNA lysidine(34) synthetase TilS [Janthinobacterium sp. PC23-8]|uniref:tRNA lysidine(34) synthetase TilS n=1 Tax=Janthinobacterium sp. PC23-8 TaxID=2012679 RepID=UPI000B96A6C3|nr:tRNA lysidine(34) synthetase TilS [Janthinobacterium sp. PC23-8]OYO27528.1 tRNA lysidine(34) synthetase TilS [Janthinobacterium sp. PC23-8]
MKKPQTAGVADIFARALQDCAPQPGDTIGIALSGGLDSSALLHLAQAWSQEQGVSLRAFHVHHGLSPNADAWLAHCEALCASLGVPFEASRVSIEVNPKTGTEEAARKRRYGALGALCAQHGVRLLLTAHHQDDQAETVLLQLLRGSGTAGLSGMDGANSAPELLANPDLVMARPLLPVSRKQLEAYVAKHAIAHIHDESNDDARFARNALRHQVMPVLAQAFPGFQERFARSARHAQSAQRLLTELATQDLAHCLDGDCLELAKLRELSTDRCYNLLRHWFGTRNLRMPSTAWLAQMLAQLLEARPDAQLLVTHPECHVRRHRDRLYLTPKLADLAGMRERDDANIPGLEKAGQQFHWQGQASIAFPAYGGVLHFDPVAEGEQGVDTAWLQAQTLTIDFRQGGERLKLALNRPTKSLKYHYQAVDVPAWERERLPLVSAAQQLLYAAGIGLDCHCLGLPDQPRVNLRWVAR